MNTKQLQRTNLFLYKFELSVSSGRSGNYSPLFFVPTSNTKKDWEGTHHIYLLYFLPSFLKTGFHSG